MSSSLPNEAFGQTKEMHRVKGLLSLAGVRSTQGGCRDALGKISTLDPVYSGSDYNEAPFQGAKAKSGPLFGPGFFTRWCDFCRFLV